MCVVLLLCLLFACCLDEEAVLWQPKCDWKLPLPASWYFCKWCEDSLAASLLAVCEDVLRAIATVMVSAPVSCGRTRHCWHLVWLEATLSFCILLWAGPGQCKGLTRANGKNRVQRKVRLSILGKGICKGIPERQVELMRGMLSGLLIFSTTMWYFCCFIVFFEEPGSDSHQNCSECDAWRNVVHFSKNP